MSNKELIAAAIKKLQKASVEIEDDAPIQRVCGAINIATGVARKPREAMADYINDYLRGTTNKAAVKNTFVPQKATAPDWGRRPAYKPPAHFRDHEFSQLPKPISMSGPGLGNNAGYGRGR